MPDLPPLDGSNLLDYAETLLCNAVCPDHCRLDDWNSYVKHWRDAKHGSRFLKDRALQMRKQYLEAIEELYTDVEAVVAIDVQEKVKAYIHFLEQHQAVKTIPI